MIYTGNLLTLLNVYSLIGGFTMVSVFRLHGANFLSLKLEGNLGEQSRKFSKRLYVNAVMMFVLLAITTYALTDIRTKVGINPGIVPIASMSVLLITIYFSGNKMAGWAFIATGVNIILTQVTFYTLMFPRVMVSSINPAYDLTIYNSSSSQYTLSILAIIAISFLPFVLAYQGWTYYIFRTRISMNKKKIIY